MNNYQSKRLVFWQNKVSPHQMPYINHLPHHARVSEVILVVAEDMTRDRLDLGWEEVTVNPAIKVYVKPNKVIIHKLLVEQEEQSIHFFSGLRGFLFVFQCFKTSLTYNVKRGIISESPFFYKAPKIAHWFKTLLLDQKYFKHINYVYAIGEEAVNWYSQWNCNWKVIEFAYATESPSIKNKPTTKPLKFVFVGSLCKRKNVSLLIKAWNKLPKGCSLHIIGDGPLKKELQQMARKEDIVFHGVLAQREVLGSLHNYDILVLPSLFDGWGAVINEGIMAGNYIICSDSCGAKSLISKKSIGLVFKSNNLSSLSKNLLTAIKNQSIIQGSFQERINYSHKITGKSIALYFIESLNDNKYHIPYWKR